MDWNARHSGGNLASPDAGRASPVVLRLLSAVPHPPAAVLVVSASEQDARALDARGYRVERAGNGFFDGDEGGRFDVVCEGGQFSSLGPADRRRYVDAAARALRSGGKLFGVMYEGGGLTAGEIIHLFAPHFEVERLEPSAFAGPEAGLVPLEVILVRR